MKAKKLLIVVALFLIIISGCQKKEEVVVEKKQRYTSKQVRNRNLKSAVDNYNQEFFRAASSDLLGAYGQSLNEKDRVVYETLVSSIDKKLLENLTILDSLSVKGKLFAFDFEYKALTKNFQTDPYRKRLREMADRFMVRQDLENRAVLANYYGMIDSLPKELKVTKTNHKIVVSSPKSPIQVKIIQDGFNAPYLIMEVRLSQLETILETFMLKSGDYELFFNKNSREVADYNNLKDKLIVFEITDNSPINYDALVTLLSGDKMNLKVKWFYEAENIVISQKKIAGIKTLLKSFEELHNEYSERANSIYVPKYVKSSK